ncbi:hypothetical protein QR680_017636 [Steinernema hermaphroditum]|uniref:Thioredoxin domain-containing protein n=1 Tax=Steinernema hermaphroditum TaxID=289476 RepID=A0AA39HGH6_9BILA|nr:hypothetical protein QR680_017636 [Steinernema hermaphroditum]
MAELLADVELCRLDGKRTTGLRALEDKVVAFFFSAQWCAPCRGFTPILKEFYEELEDCAFEVVFVSCDKSEHELLAYMADSHGNWLYVPFSSSQITLLTKRYNVDGIPMLIVVKADGTEITRDGRSEVLSKAPINAFNSWKSQL